MRHWRAAIFAVGCLVFGAGGCRPAGGEDFYRKFTDEDPSVRLSAIQQAGDAKDQQAAPYLVDRLTDVEPEVPFYAILALEKITGTRNGYQYYAPQAERDKAVAQWRQWLQSRAKPAAEPSKERNP